MGNTRVLFAASASDTLVIKQVVHYYPFGLQLAGIGSTGGSDNKFLYNGKELEDEHNLYWYHYGARYYDPQLGLWHSIDPADEFYSPYVYVGNDPVNLVDKDGSQSGKGANNPFKSHDEFLKHYRKYQNQWNWTDGGHWIGKESMPIVWTGVTHSSTSSLIYNFTSREAVERFYEGSKTINNQVSRLTNITVVILGTTLPPTRMGKLAGFLLGVLGAELTLSATDGMVGHVETGDKIIVRTTVQVIKSSISQAQNKAIISVSITHQKNNSKEIELFNYVHEIQLDPEKDLDLINALESTTDQTLELDDPSPSVLISQ